MKKKTIIFLIIGIFLLGILSFAFFYINDYYKASIDVNNYLNSSEEVKVSKKDGVYVFDGKGEESAIVFYQGGKVDNISYAPLLFKLAEKGIDCYLVDMPFRLAILNINNADNVIKKYNYDNWYIMGHSLGGSTAAMYTSNHSDKVKGLILLAAYSTNMIDENIKVLSIYGSEDGVLNMNKYVSNKKNLVNLKEVIIDGGNHSYFGYYGDQKGDNKAIITREKQQERTIDEIELFIGG